MERTVALIMQDRLPCGTRAMLHMSRDIHGWDSSERLQRKGEEPVQENLLAGDYVSIVVLQCWGPRVVRDEATLIIDYLHLTGCGYLEMEIKTGERRDLPKDKDWSLIG